MLPSLLRPMARHGGVVRALVGRRCAPGRIASVSATVALSEWLITSTGIGNRLEHPHLPRSYTTSTSVSNAQVGRLVSGDNHAKSAWETELLPAFRSFKDVYGHLNVDADFVVPSGDTRWPESTWGLALGETERQLQHQQRHGEKKLPVRVVHDLDALGFVWDVAQFRWDHIILPALRRFSELHGHTDVPRDFVVRDGATDWPELSWRLPLGKTVARIRSGETFAVQVAASTAELEHLSFCSDTSIYDREWREEILPALDVFRHEHGHCIIKPNFVVPSTTSWPSKMRGMSLGAIAQGLRSGELYADQAARDMDDLNDLGFAWNTSDAEWAERISPALTTFVQTKGDFRVERSFTVPAQRPWPKRTHGLKLGRVLANMRTRGDYFPQLGRDAGRLERTGFQIKLTAAAWKKHADPLVAIFTKLHPGKQLPPDFVVPATASWPEKMWGVQLGCVAAQNAHRMRRVGRAV